MKTPDYLSYERYKKKKTVDPRKKTMIYIAAFFATVLLFMGIVKSLSPDVDVTIGDGTEMEPKETGLGVKKFIDDRLKMIQMDDNSGKREIKEPERNAKYNSSFNYAEETVSEEKVKVPNHQKDEEEILLDEDTPVKTQRTSQNSVQSSQSAKSTPVKTVSPASKVSKVYVGRYSTLEQAKVAQEILMDSGLGITPFVKNMGSSYTLQIGSYSNRAKAENVVSELQRNSFPARIVQE